MTDGQDQYYTVYCKAAREYQEKNNTTFLPDYFVSSAEIPWINRVKAQAAMQDHIDTAISSTVNLPQSATKDDVAMIYLNAWKHGLKGITIFRDGCKKLGILTTEETKNDNNAPEETAVHHKHEVAKDESELSRGDILNCSMDLVGKKRKLQTGCGSLHVLAFFDPTNGELQEVYFNKGSTGGCANFMTGLSRTVSLLCRAGVDIETIKDQLDSCGVCPSYATRSATKHDTSKGSCCPMAIGNALMDMWKEMQEDISDDCDELLAEDIKLPTVDAKTDTAPLKMANKGVLDIDNDVCPECGSKLSHIGGCIQCTNCAWSKCG